MKIFCLYYNGKYTPDYVSKLYHSLKKFSNCQFEFICYSDNPTVVADRVIPLPEITDIKAHWHKLKFFDSTFANQKSGEEIIVLDIDQIVINQIDCMLTWPVAPGELSSYSKWWNLDSMNPMQLNGGWYKFISGSLDYVYKKYINNPTYWQLYYFDQKIVTIPYYGEQNFVQDTVLEHNGKLNLMPGQWVAKYQTTNQRENLHRNLLYIKKFNEPYMFLDGEWNKNIKIIHFTDLLNVIHTSEEPWIRECWQ